MQAIVGVQAVEVARLIRRYLPLTERPLWLFDKDGGADKLVLGFIIQKLLGVRADLGDDESSRRVGGSPCTVAAAALRRQISNVLQHYRWEDHLRLKKRELRDFSKETLSEVEGLTTETTVLFHIRWNGSAGLAQVWDLEKTVWPPPAISPTLIGNLARAGKYLAEAATARLRDLSAVAAPEGAQAEPLRSLTNSKDRSQPYTPDRETIALATLAKIGNPNISEVARLTGIPRSTLNDMPLFRKAVQKMLERGEATRRKRRGRRAGDGDFEAIPE
jgi:hypothetical protein